MAVIQSLLGPGLFQGFTWVFSDPHNTLWGGGFYSHFADEEIECLGRSHQSPSSAKAKVSPRFFWLLNLWCIQPTALPLRHCRCLSDRCLYSHCHPRPFPAVNYQQADTSFFVEWAHSNYSCDLRSILFLMVVKFTYHKVYHFQVYSSVALSTFTWLCNHHHFPSPELLHLPQLKVCPH